MDCGRNIRRKESAMPRINTILRYFQQKPSMLLVAVVVIILIAIGLTKLVSSKDDEADTGSIATFTVTRGPLRISVTESGTIKAREQVILKSEVEGRTSILTLVPEGTHVKKGDLLIELDASGLLDSRIDQEIRVQNTEASFISAEENFAVVENQAQSDLDKAELSLDFARQDLKQYLEGEYPKQTKEAEARITLAREEVARAVEKLKWSQKLFDEKYISNTELQADELAKTRKNLDLDLAKADLDLLNDFTYQRTVKQLESDAKQAEMALERTKRKAKADVKQAEANLKAKESEYNRQQSKLKKIEEQIAKTKIYAPADGLAIYATSAQRGHWRSSTEPLDEGQDVRERQELIYLPTGTSVKVEVAVHEASLKKVKLGLPAIITVDALPGKSFFGTVASIAPLPDAQSMWMNPDLKVYNTEIYLDGNDGALRTGMSCKTQIIVEQYEDAIYVPIQAVLRIGGETTVFVMNGKKHEPRKVEIGLDNNRMVRIISGLEQGEVVLLTPPLKSAEVKPHSGSMTPETNSSDTDSDTIDSKASERLKNGVSPPEQQEKEEEKKGRPQLTPEQRKQMQERFKNMSPEEREKMRQQRRPRN